MGGRVDSEPIICKSQSLAILVEKMILTMDEPLKRAYISTIFHFMAIL